jgi:dCMP deaminase
MRLAMAAKDRSTCCRRAVGCILVNEYNEVIGTGYNGVPRGFAHCTDVPCAGANSASGTNLDLCQAVHAEINALVQCRNTREIHTVYVTTSPCWSCTLALLNTTARRLVYKYPYPHVEAREMWIRSGRELVHFKG